MPNATANRADVRYVAESVWGTTPATPALKLFRMTGETLNAGIQSEVSQEIREDRNEQDLIQVGSEAGGGLDFELSYSSFDDWLEAVLCSSWVLGAGDTYTLVNGVLEKSFSVQKRFSDVTRYMLFTGVRANTMNLSIGPNKIITGSFGCLAKGATSSASGFAGATLPAGPTNVPMNGAAGVTLNQVDGAAITGGLMNFSLDVNNNLRAQDAVGSLSAQAVVNGKFQVTGDFEVYFADGSLYDKFQNMTAMAIKLEMTETGVANKITIDVPRAKLETAEVVAQGTDTDVMLKSTYRGLYDVTTVGSLKLTKDGPA